MGSEVMMHVLVVTFNSQGHLNPMLRLAKRIAANGLLVTFSTTADVGLKIRKANKLATDSEQTPIGEGHLRFEFFSDGWSDVDSRRVDLDLYVPQLKTAGSTAVADLIRRQAELGRPVSYVVSNPFVPWALDVATEMGLPCAMLWVQSCAVFSVYYHYYHKLVEFPTTNKPGVSVRLPGIPTLHADELPTFLLPNTPYTTLAELILEQFKNLSKASWVFVNSFEELEHDTLQALSKVRPLIPIGPLIELSENGNSQVRADLLKVADCMGWLDKQEPGSVVYASVGSVAVLSREEMAEMAHGFRKSRRPFLWVVREESRELLPEGFAEETAGHGLVVPWSPQDQVLSHRSTACFLTHCGWNSTLECLTSGLPVIAFPQWGDQMTDAKFLVEVYKVGVHLRPRTTNGNAGTASFTRGDVERSIEEVTEGPAAEEMKKNAAKWKKVAREAAAAGGSSDQNIQAFVDEIRRRQGLA